MAFSDLLLSPGCWRNGSNRGEEEKFLTERLKKIKNNREKKDQEININGKGEKLKKIFVKTETQIMIVIHVYGKNKYFFFWGGGVIWKSLFQLVNY